MMIYEMCVTLIFGITPDVLLRLLPAEDVRMFRHLLRSFFSANFRQQQKSNDL